MWEYLDGLYDYPTMADRGVAATRQFAKRQLTWLRADHSTLIADSLQPALLDVTIKLLQAQQLWHNAP